MKTIPIPYALANKANAHPPPFVGIKKWLHLAFWLLIIWTFIFVLGPIMQKIPAVGTLSRYITANGIDAGALYYTEVEEVGESDQAVRNTLRFFLPQE